MNYFWIYIASNIIMLASFIYTLKLHEQRLVILNKWEVELMIISVICPVINTISALYVIYIVVPGELKLLLAKIQILYDAWIIRQTANVEARIIKRQGIDFYIKYKERDYTAFKNIKKYFNKE